MAGIQISPLELGAEQFNEQKTSIAHLLEQILVSFLWILFKWIDLFKWKFATWLIKMTF